VAPPGLSVQKRQEAGVLPPWRRAKQNVGNQTQAVPMPVRKAPPGLAPPGLESCQRGAFNIVSFRKEMTSTLHELEADRNVGKAVRRIRAHSVPVQHQACVLTDLLTRGAEEFRGPARRCFFAFAVGLGSGDISAFDKDQFINGTKAFFDEVYESLCEEAPQLPKIVAAELLPVLCPAFSDDAIKQLVPTDLWTTYMSRQQAMNESSMRTNAMKKQRNEACDTVYDAKSFQRTVVETFREIAIDKDVAKGVRRLRGSRVPVSKQASEVSNMMTRASEETRGCIRRVLFAFVCALVAGTPSAFDREQFIGGMLVFFTDVYPSLCEEDPKFHNVATRELVQALRSVLSQTELNRLLPPTLRKL